MDRRGFLKVGASSLLALWASRLGSSGRARAEARPPAKAKACIVLWMNGGPSHVDTWDPKPGSTGAGKFKPIKTAVEGIEICEHLPRVAELAGKLTILRGMTSKEGNHDRAQHLLHTGFSPNPTVSYPSLGSWAAEELGDPTTDLPGFVSISGPSFGAGFLGVQYGPFVVPDPKQPPANTNYARNVDFARFVRRRGALAALEEQFAVETGDPKIKQRETVYAKAVRLMYSPRLKAFELGDEPDAARAAYGETDFGRGCLMARRLVEAGVKFVEVVLDGWDTHKDNFGKTEKLMGALDPAMAALIKDLDERKLLDSTLVMWMGDFGRTPKINENDGRDHHPGAWSAVLAGGGARGGLVHGATDGDGDKVVDKPTAVADLFATAATLLGLDPGKEVVTPRGRPVTLTDNGKPIPALMA
jgi:Protein of unknown function (DUF1501)